ncbi:MAG: hypothetical protein AAFV71_21785 [Cyanobacteria bacterium J06633_8]
MDNLPNKLSRLTTRETEHLLEQYPEIEYLEAGHVGDWLITRKDQLLILAREERIGSGLAKTAGVLVGAAGFIFHATSPLAPFGILAGAAGFIWSLLADSSHTHTFNPIPFVRGGIFEVVGSLGHSAARQEFTENYDEFDQLKGYLSPVERKEYEMLREHSGLITEYLSHVESGKRFYAYRWIVDQYILLRGSFPSPEQTQQHVNAIQFVSPLVDCNRIDEIKSLSSPITKSLIKELPKPSIKELPKPNIVDRSQQSVSDSHEGETLSPRQDTPQQVNKPTQLTDKLSKLPTLPLKQRAVAIIELLKSGGFKIDECLSGQITAIAGTQRGGKGTLAGILTILLKAATPKLNAQYFTAGVDVYPFACNLTSALTYTGRDIEAADKLVAQDLLKFLKKLQGAKPYSQKNLLLVVDEAMRLFSLMDEAERNWALQFLLTRFEKTGAGLILVLHATSLGAVVGSKNTSGMAATFKEGINFIGCYSQSIQADFLRKMSVASGKYFKANPNNFGTPEQNGELGEIPEWLKTEMHPGNGQPDPVRTLLKYFPELLQEHDETPIPQDEKLADLDDVNKLEFTLQLNEEPHNTKPVETRLSDNSQKIFDWLKNNRQGQWVKYKGNSNRDMSFIKWLSQNGIKGDDKEEAIIELYALEIIEISGDETAIMAS